MSVAPQNPSGNPSSPSSPTTGANPTTTQPNTTPGKRTPSGTQVGFVAPDAEGGVLYNTFIIRPEYRISIHFFPQDMDLIFPETIQTDKGKQSRLQPLWYYHHPLDYTEAAPTPADPDWKTPLVDCWNYFKKNEGTQPANNADPDARVPLTDPQAYDRVKLQLGTKIVDCTIDKRDSLGKLFLWGGYSMFNEQSYTDYFLKAVDGAKTSRHVMEEKTIKANAGLNRIPIIVRVQKRYSPAGEWIPAESVWVYFQLVDPKLKNDGQPAAAALAQARQQAVTAAAGPRQTATQAQTAETNALNAYQAANATYQANPTPGNLTAAQNAWTAFDNARTAAMAAERAAAPTAQAAMQAGHKEYVNKVFINDRQGVAATDPQRENASNTRGGKRGNPVGGNDVTKHIFFTDDHEGFNKKPTAPGKLADFNKSRQTPEQPNKERREFLKPILVNDAKIPNSVKAQTNEDGESGVLFMPSVCGGDRYKLRVFVGPGTLDSDGKEIEKDPDVLHVAESCTMEVWRRARVSQMLELRQGALTAIGTGTGSIIDVAYEKGWLDLIYDRPAMGVITDAKWRAVYAKSRTKALANASSPSLNQFRTKIKIDKLLPADPSSATDPSWIPMLSIANYNAGLPAAFKKILDAGNTANDNLWISVGIDEIRSFMLNDMLAQFTMNGHLPGITKIRAAVSLPNEYESRVLNSFLGGMSMSTHGCYTFLNDADYHNKTWRKSSAIPTEAIAIHEIGHTWLLRHQFTDNGDNDGWNLNTLHEHYFENIVRAGGPPPSGTAFTYTYNTPPTATKICNMSYHPDIAGDFCGKCLLSLGGWNVVGIPEPA